MVRIPACHPETSGRVSRSLGIQTAKALQIFLEGFFYLKYAQRNVMYYTYILQSEKDQSFYIGYTSNLEHRLYEHNEGFSRYTKHKRPWKIVYFEKFEEKSDM